MVGSSINALPGRNFLLKLGNGTTPETYTTITGMRATDITINGNPVDITNKSSQGWQELLPNAGVKSCDITASGIYDTNSSGGLTTLAQAALDGGTILPMEVVSGAGDKFVGYWAVQSFKRTGPYNEAETFDVTLKSHGYVQHVAAP
jgi:TP901-1 family phage major tail protein